MAVEIGRAFCEEIPRELDQTFYIPGLSIINQFHFLEMKKHPQNRFLFLELNLIVDYLSDTETEIWETINEKSSIIDPKLPHAKFVHGVALYIVDSDFCKK